MSQESSENGRVGPDHEGTERFAAALGVKRNATIAVGVSVVMTVLLYVTFVVLPPDTTHSPLLYAALAAVIWFALALTLTLALTIYSAWKLTRDG